jgi:hypothetical protein
VSSDPPPPQQPSAALVVAGAHKPRIWEDIRLQKLWLAVQRREWRSLAVLAASKGVDTIQIAELLAHVAWTYRGQPSCVFDLRDLSLRLADYQMREVQAQVEAGTRVMIALRSTGENPTAVPIARQADAVVLCIGMGETRIKSVEGAIAEVGRDKVLGSIIVRRPPGKGGRGKGGRGEDGAATPHP